MSQSQRPIDTLCLSGGGFRAAFYHLGVMAFLQHEQQLAKVRNIVSVSGGSILSVYAALHWEEFVKSNDGFAKVAADFVSFTRMNPRNKVVIPWLWSRLLLVNWFAASWGRTRRLQKVYHQLYGDATFESLKNGAPNLVVVATDSIRQERVGFTNNEVLRFQFSGVPVQPAFSSHGVHVSLAVAASSCFPPVFPRMKLTYKDLGLSYNEFKDVLFLDDGGVVTNLGIEMLLKAIPDALHDGRSVAISDATRPLAHQPANHVGADVSATESALSEAARESLARQLEHAKTVKFADRLPSGSLLSHLAETELRQFRTDLDAPTWPELHALMIKGALQATMVFGRPTPDSPTACGPLELIQTILQKADCKAPITIPSDADLRRCGVRPLKSTILHGLVVGALLLGEAFGFYRGGLAAYGVLSYRNEYVRLIGEMEKRKEHTLARLHECMKMPHGPMQERCIKELETDMRDGNELIDRFETARQRDGKPLSSEQQKVLRQFRESTGRLALANNLKQIGTAISVYRDTRGELPGGNGRRCWRMDILPYLVQSSLVPETPPRGLPPIARKIFQYPGNENPTETNIVAVKGRGSFWDTEGKKQVIQDGTENLIVALAVHGTGIAIDDNRDLSVEEAMEAILGGRTPFATGTFALLADGRVRLIGQQIDKSTLRQLLTNSEPIEP